MKTAGFGRRAAVGLVLVAALIVLMDVDRAPGGQAAGESRLIGIKAYDYTGDLRTLFEEWRGLGINTAFVSPALASKPGFMKLARGNGIAVFLIVPVFFNDEELKKRPDLAALTQDGKVASDDWVKFICPSREGYRRRIAGTIDNLVRGLNPDGISLDFIRFFVFWEKVYPGRTLDSLPNSCFEGHCVEEFQRDTGITVPKSFSTPAARAGWILKEHPNDWTRWKCGLIAEVVKDLADTARKAKPGIKINIHSVPWRANDFGGAVKAIAGQNLTVMTAYSDYVSPMCYHHMVKQTPAWVHSVVEDVASRVRVPVLPSIQVKEAYIPDKLTVAEFKQALIEALKPPSRGVVFWSWDSLGPDKERKAVVKALCGAK
jgi:hypothetical protein